MIFNSIEYFLFLPLFFLFYWFVFNKRLFLQNCLILVGSYTFYAFWSWKFLLLLVFITVLDYLYGFGVASKNKKKSKLFLWLSVINNLGVLAVFKYYNFFITELSKFISVFGINPNFTLLSIVLPIGISFYTFHGMSYVFDIYRGKIKPISNIVDYSVFVSFFPLLVAGPIERADHLLPQIQRKRIFDYATAVSGTKLIIWGLFKKVVVADNLAIIADAAFDKSIDTNAITLIMGLIAFSFQIYGDFSGYTDIALGSAKLLGFELLSNFRFPYFSKNIAEFWKRWHISLSSWFRDYLYIPLGGSKAGNFKTYRNILIVFLVSGFWHGASWNFIVWGGLHAAGFILMSLYDDKNEKAQQQPNNNSTIRDGIKIFGTFCFVALAWVFFRAENLEKALFYVSHIVINLVQHPGQLLLIPEGSEAILFILPLLLLDWRMRFNERELALKRWQLLILSLFVLYYFNKNISEPGTFIYFQF